jgi:hypothetical protein
MRDDTRGIGPRGYTRSDPRIFEDVCEALSCDGELDARYLRVTVKGGRVLLDGRVSSRDEKYLAEQLADRVAGVSVVENRLRIDDRRVSSAFAEIHERGVFAQLIHEHRLVAAMFDIVVSTPATEPDDRLASFATLARELIAHSHAEDEIVYEALADSHAVGRRIDQARTEHEEIERMIREIEALGDADEHWLGKVRALQRAVEHHVEIEEQLILPRAHTVLDDRHVDDMLELYRRVRARETAKLQIDTTATAWASRRGERHAERT